MVKHYSEKTFDFVNGKGNVEQVYCYTTYTRNGLCHTAKLINSGELVKVSWGNRPWECFIYETALNKLFEKHYKGAELDGLKAQIKDIEDAEIKSVEEWTSRMTKMCSLISDKGKERVAKAIDDNNIETAEGMETAIMLAVALGL